MKNSVEFWWQIFFQLFPRRNGLKFVTSQTSEIFTTFSTARTEMYHLELALGATSRNNFALAMLIADFVGVVHGFRGPILTDFYRKANFGVTFESFGGSGGSRWHGGSQF